MAKPKFITGGDTALKLNWVIKVVEDIANININMAYKIIAIDENDSLAIVVPFKDIKDSHFVHTRHRSAAYKKFATSISLYTKVNVYGTHFDNITKEHIAKEKAKEQKLEKAELIKNLGLSRELEDVLIRIVKEYESSLHDEMIKKFEDQLVKLKIDGINYRGQFKSLTLSEIAIKRLNTLGAEGWMFCFELSEKYYFQRPRLKKS